MSVTKRRLRQVAAAALAAITALGAARGLRQRRRQAGSRREADKLVVDTFGEFGYDDLVKQYETGHRHQGRAAQDRAAR